MTEPAADMCPIAIDGLTAAVAAVASQDDGVPHDITGVVPVVAELPTAIANPLDGTVSGAVQA